VAGLTWDSVDWQLIWHSAAISVSGRPNLLQHPSREPAYYFKIFNLLLLVGIASLGQI
jgi:hypothetical protein